MISRENQLPVRLNVFFRLISSRDLGEFLHLGTLALRDVPLIVPLLQVETHPRFGSEGVGEP